MIPYKQLSLADIFQDCQEIFNNDKPAFLSLLENHIDLDEIIPVSFYNHFQNKADMEGYERKEGMEDREEIYSKPVRAGKRTYFFDVKATRNNDYYLTITESKKKFDNDGNASFEKHKIFLYKEDFEKFAEGLSEAVEVVKEALEGRLPQH